MDLVTLTILAGGAVGVAVVLACVHWAGGTRAEPVDTVAAAHAALAVEHPELEPGRTDLDLDGRGALIDLGFAGVALVVRGGAWPTVLRPLPEDLARTRWRDHAVVFCFADLGTAPVRLRLSPEALAWWRERLTDAEGRSAA